MALAFGAGRDKALDERARDFASVLAAKPFCRARCLTAWPAAWTYWGWKNGYFDCGEADARAYFDEMRHMLAAQMAAPNSPQWFNTGLHWAYGVDGPSQGPFLRRREVTRQDEEIALKQPMSARSRTPALSSPSPTIS